MLRIMKYMKKNTGWIFLIFLLLFGQAYADLALPEYTSKIIDTGIQQKGIEDAVPDQIRGASLAALAAVSADPQSLTDQYEIKSEASKNASDGEDAEAKSANSGAANTGMMGPELSAYAGIDAQATYQLKEMNQKAREAFAQKLETSELTLMMVLKQGMNPLTLTPEQQSDLLNRQTKLLEEYPDSMVKQAGIQFVAEEYKALGVDLDHKQSNYVFRAGMRMLAMAGISMICAVIVTLIASRISSELGMNLRNRIYRRVMSFSSNEMNQFSTASLITRSTNDIQQVQMVMTLMLRLVLYAPILAAGGLIKVISNGRYLSWTLGIGIGMIALTVAVVFGLAMPKFRKLQELIDKMNLIAREILTGIPVIRAFSTQLHEEERFEKANQNLTKTNLFVNRVMSVMMPMMMLILNIVSILIIYAGSHGVGDGKIQVGDMMAFIQYAMQIIFSFLMMTMMAVFMPRANVSAKRILEVLDMEPSIHSPKEAEAAPEREGSIEFEHVSFSYPGAEEEVLHDISFTASKGQTIGLIGGTGSGKSTLLNLIPRFFDVTAGRILIDGVDIRSMDLKELRDRLGVVPQKSVLFSGTIASNLRFGAEDAPDEAIWRAVDIAQAEEFVSKNSESIDAHISQGGSNVSGGQKQRLAIARAVASDPEFYLFDDSFSALDFKTDVILRRKLKEEAGSATRIIVGQRISTIMDADRILVLDEGRIVGAGTHAQLLDTCEVYQQIAKSQLSEEELGV